MDTGPPPGLHIKVLQALLGGNSLDSEAWAEHPHLASSRRLGPHPCSQGYSLLGPRSQASMGAGHPGKEMHSSHPVFPQQVGNGAPALLEKAQSPEPAGPWLKLPSPHPAGAAPALSISDASGLWPELLQQVPPRPNQSPQNPQGDSDCWPRELGSRLEQLQAQMNRWVTDLWAGMGQPQRAGPWQARHGRPLLVPRGHRCVSRGFENESENLKVSHSVVSDSLRPRQEYWSGSPFPFPGDHPNPGIEPRSPALQVDSLPAEPQGKPNDLRMASPL